MEFLDFLYSGDLYGEIAVGARNLTQSAAWYCANLDLVEGASSTQEVTLGYRGGKGRSVIPLVTLVQVSGGRTNVAVEGHPILFCRNLAKARQKLVSNGITASHIQHDSGGNHFFEFKDLDGNRIEVCLEPGKKLE